MQTPPCRRSSFIPILQYRKLRPREGTLLKSSGVIIKLRAVWLPSHKAARPCCRLVRPSVNHCQRHLSDHLCCSPSSLLPLTIPSTFIFERPREAQWWAWVPTVRGTADKQELRFLSGSSGPSHWTALPPPRTAAGSEQEHCCCAVTRGVGRAREGGEGTEERAEHLITEEKSDFLPAVH